MFYLLAGFRFFFLRVGGNSFVVRVLSLLDLGFGLRVLSRFFFSCLSYGFFEGGLFFLARLEFYCWERWSGIGIWVVGFWSL